MVQSTFPKVADQIVSFNKNVVDILTKINTLITTTDTSVNIQVYDEAGTLRSFNLPSFSAIKSEIDRLNNNINSLYGIDANGAMIQTSNANKFRKLITVDLNREPAPLTTLGGVTQFKSDVNWFFDSLLDPLLSVEFDITGAVEDNVRKCLVRRYIVNFAKDTTGAFTPLGQSALNSFNSQFRGNATVVLQDFLNWHSTTPGVVEPNNPKYDEQVFDLQPNELQYDGVFSILRVQEDRINKKLWYVLDTLDYLVISTNTTGKLAAGNEVIINAQKTSTRYKVIEVNTAQSLPRVRFERVEGIEPLSVGVGTLKIYSPVVLSKKIRVSLGYNERNLIFMKPINAENHLVARRWSLGTGYWSNDLRLSSDSDDNGKTMEQYYTEVVYDYGLVLQDLVAKKTPNKLAGTPVAPTLNADNFKVVQINKHLTDTPDSNLIKQKFNSQNSLKSELNQIESAIMDRNKISKVSKFKSESDKKIAVKEIDELVRRKDTKIKQQAALTQEIIDLSKSPKIKVQPKFRVRGFWTIPDPVVTRGTKPQEIVQFRVQYRYVSKDGRESPVETFDVSTVNARANTKVKASFSNWKEFKTDARKRIFNPKTSEYSWQIEDISSADTPNINQLDVDIQSNEKIEIRIKSISEVGWPESPVESDWSEILAIEFPDDLNNVLNENNFILQEATKEDLKIKMSSELTSRGLDEHLSDTIVVSNKVYHHDSNKILSGFKDANGTSLDLYEYLKFLEDRVKGLEEKIKKAKGELEVVIIRNNQEFVVSRGSETTFNIDCENYMDPFSGTGVATGRVFANNVYVIKDFVIKVRNKATESILGLVSNRNYLSSSEIYNTGAPQTFWVNNRHELITSDSTGQTRSHLDNQFIWMVNYDSVTQNSVSKLSENIGNGFIKNNNNSITNILSSNEFNVGFNETSILGFVGNNKSLLDSSKWVDKTVSVASTNKLLTTIHPVVKDLESIVETNSDKVKDVDPGDKNSIIIPINIYFKVNALDINQKGLNYRYVDFNSLQSTVQHVKKLKFFIENEAENRPFTFSIKFNLFRNKVVVQKVASPVNLYE